MTLRGSLVSLDMDNSLNEWSVVRHVRVDHEWWNKIIDEPRSSGEAPRDVALPRCNNIVGNCLSHILSLFLRFHKRTGFVEKANIHGYFHLSHHAVVHQLSLRDLKRLRPPVSVVALEATREGSLCVGGYSLKRVVLEMLDGWNWILNNLWGRVYWTFCVCTENLSTVLFPVGSIKNPDVVFDKPTPVLKSV